MRFLACLLMLIAGIGTATADEPGRTLQIGVRDTRFTLNNKPVFLLGCSYYGALGANEITWKADLDDLQKSGFNWIRIWATWAAYDHDVSAVDGQTGEVREDYLNKLKSILAECDRREIIVDVTLSRGSSSTGPVRLQTHDAHRRAVETLTTSLKPWRNWYLDLGNERNIGDQRFVSIKQLKDLRSLVRKLDVERLVTASHGGDLSADDVRDYVMEVQVDFLCPHRPRDKHSPGQTESTTRQLLQTMKELGRVVPVHYQEPFRRGYPGYPPEAGDYLTDLHGALAGGAAGWCFHNGATRGAKDEEPRRSFDLRAKRLFMQLDDIERDVVGRLNEVIATSAPIRN